MAHTHTENVGLISETIAYLKETNNQTALKAKNFDPAPHVLRLQGKLDGIMQVKAQQEQAKVALNHQTQTLNQSMSDGYTDASGVIDAMMGLLGKNSSEARHLHTLRSKIRRGTNGDAPSPAVAKA
jgi:hypothetical protein